MNRDQWIAASRWGESGITGSQADTFERLFKVSAKLAWDNVAVALHTGSGFGSRFAEQTAELWKNGHEYCLSPTMARRESNGSGPRDFDDPLPKDIEDFFGKKLLLKPHPVVSRRPIGRRYRLVIQAQIYSELGAVVYQVIEEHLPVG